MSFRCFRCSGSELEETDRSSNRHLVTATSSDLQRRDPTDPNLLTVLPYMILPFEFIDSKFATVTNRCREGACFYEVSRAPSPRLRGPRPKFFVRPLIHREADISPRTKAQSPPDKSPPRTEAPPPYRVTYTKCDVRFVYAIASD